MSEKKRRSCFCATDLDFLLRSMQIEVVVIPDIMSDCCDICAAFEASNMEMKRISVLSCSLKLDKTYSLWDKERRLSNSDTYRYYPTYAYLTQSVFVKVDEGTGEVKVLTCISVNDVGRAINPTIIEGQSEGSCSMGIGYAISESYPQEKGVPTVKYFNPLGLARMDETSEYQIALVKDPEPHGPFGAKGISEVAIVPTTPVVLNAIYDAVGVRMYSVPAKPEPILAALRVKNTP